MAQGDAQMAAYNANPLIPQPVKESTAANLANSAAATQLAAQADAEDAKEEGGEKGVGAGKEPPYNTSAPGGAGAPPMQVGMGVTGQSVQSSFIPKAEQEKLDKANASALNAQAQLTEQETAAAKRNEEAQKAEAARQAIANAQAQQQERQRQDIQTAEYQKSVDALNEVKNGKFKDADDYWKEKGIGAHIAGTIGIALSELGSKMAGGPNTALGMIDRKVEQYIQKSKEEVAHTKDMAQLQHNQYAQLLQKGMDERQAESTMRAVANEQASQALKAKLAEGGDAMAKANGQVVAAELQKRAAQHDADIKKGIVQRTMGPTINGIPAGMYMKAQKGNPGQAHFDNALNAIDEMRARYKSGTPMAYSQALSRYAIPIAEGLTGRPVRNMEQAIKTVEDIAPGKMKQLFGDKGGAEGWDQIEGIVRGNMKAGFSNGGGGGGGAGEGAEAE